MQHKPLDKWAGSIAAAALFFLSQYVAAAPAQGTVKTSSLKEQFEKTFATGHYREAVPIAEERLKLCEKVFGPEKSETLEAIHDLARAYERTDNFAKSRSLCEFALQASEKAFGKEDPATARALEDLAGVYNGQQDLAKAEALCQRALAIREKALGPEHLDVGKSLVDVAQLRAATGDFPQAIALGERALKIYEKARGPENVETARALSPLGDIYFSAGSYAKALEMDERALKIREKFLGPDHPDTAESVNNRGLLYFTAGDYTRAAQMCKRALAISEKALGPDALFTIASLNNLGFIYKTIGEFSVAEPYYRRALESRERTLGPKAMDLALSLNNLAQLLQDEGNNPEAEKLYRRALEVREAGLGPDNPDTARSLTDLGGLYLFMGDYAQAEPLFQRASKIFEKTLGPDHEDTLTSMNNLALLYDMSHQYAKAEPLYLRALAGWEKTSGPEHANTAITLSNLGVMYWQMENYEKAKPYAERALKIREKNLGPKHPKTSESLSNLGKVLRDSGDLKNAEPLFQRAVKIDEEVLGKANPETGKEIEDLAFLKIKEGKTDEALALAVRRNVALESRLAEVLSFTSERQRLAFQQTISPYRLFATLGSASNLAQTVLRQKGVVLDSLLEDRLVGEASADPKKRELVQRLRATKERAAHLILEAPPGLDDAGRAAQNQEKEKVLADAESLEKQLAREVTGLGRSRRAFSVTVPRVQAALPKDAALIEFVRYEHYIGPRDEIRYGAVVIAPDGEPRWALLGNAEVLTKKIELYQKSVRGKTDEATLSDVLHALHKQIWEPIEKALPAGTKTVIISPDGELSFLSFATLVGPDDKFVGEKYSVRYVASGRDLLREVKIGNNFEANVYANPDFGGKTNASTERGGYSVALRSVEMRDLQNISLSPLPGTAAEAAALQKRFGNSAKVFLGPKATKAQLQQVNSPRLLHLATHGFFLPEIEIVPPNDAVQREQEIPRGKLVNPMHRSGLALAGAQTTLQAWGRGEVPRPENDGVVTAEEVGGLKLDGTWLVVLSACDTGSGEARAGEGVMGLRRGFIQAGAQNLLMTLWPISDQTTVQIMLDFYDAADKTKNAPKALADVQRDWLMKLRKERGLADAVRLAGAFIMSSQGRP